MQIVLASPEINNTSVVGKLVSFVHDLFLDDNENRLVPKSKISSSAKIDKLPDFQPTISQFEKKHEILNIAAGENVLKKKISKKQPYKKK